jgi:hydroxyacylglutathione hydrolase
LPERVEELVDAGAILIDGRDQREFDAAHVPGSLNVTMNQSGVGTRAAWVVHPQSEVIVAADGDAEAHRMARMLEAVGFRNLQGFLAGGINAWRAAKLGVETTPAIDVPTLAERLKNENVVLLDVREDDEWQAGHVEDSILAPYRTLRDGVSEELRNVGKPLAVACSGGVRSALATSLLRRAGIEDVQHVADGGIPLISREGIELVESG